HASHELMLVKRARLQRLQRLFRNSQLLPGQPLDVFDPIEPDEADDRTPVLHPQRRNRQLLFTSTRSRPDGRAGRESLLDEIRLGIDDDLAFQPVWPRDASHDGPVVPTHVNPEYRAARACRASPRSARPAFAAPPPSVPAVR